MQTQIDREPFGVARASGEIMRAASLALALVVWGCETPGTKPAESSSPPAPVLGAAGAPAASSAAGTVGSAGVAGEASVVAAGASGTDVDGAAGTSASAPSIPEAGAAANAGTGAMATPASDWRTLLEGAWELPAGQEGYRCVRLTMTEDTYIKEFQPIAPPGTHHTLLSVNETPTGPDGISPCSGGDNGLVTLLGSGAGENYSAGALPEGVAYKIAKGSQLNLNLHIFRRQRVIG